MSAAYAARLLQDLALPADDLAAPADRHPAVEWAESGLMALTGLVDGPPLVCPVRLPACAHGVLAALRALSGAALPELGDGDLLLGERAALAGLSRQGPAAPGGACRFVRAADGWIAVNLARPDDFALLPALLEDGDAADWDDLHRLAPGRTTAELLTQGRLLGLALAAEGEIAAGPWFALEGPGPVASPPADRTPLVLDFSALWAGPLCAHVLSLLGARVVKVESLARPDGARGGPPDFYALMNGGKASVALDFADPAGRRQLVRLIQAADIVVDSARPRAWTQMGIEPLAMIDQAPGLTWLSITGHGRGERGAWTGFGDDAAVAAGVSRLAPRPGGGPVFVGDALADPLTGLHAALLAWATWRAGGGRLASLSLSGVVAHALAFDAAPDPAERTAAWAEELARRGIAAAAPFGRTPQRAARELGADTQSVLAELGIGGC